MKRIMGLMVVVLTAAGASQANLIYENSLQNSSDSSWMVTKGTWEWTSEGLSNSSNGENRILFSLDELGGQADLSQGYTVSFSAMVDSGKGWGFFFDSGMNSSKKVNGYTFQYDLGYSSNGSYLLRNWTNDSEGVTRSTGASLDKNIYHNFVLNIDTDSLTVYQDGSQVFSYTGNLSSKGSLIGWRTWGNTDCTFRNLSVSSVPEPASLLLFVLAGLGMVKYSCLKR
jgi:hypothetical protein